MTIEIDDDFLRSHGLQPSAQRRVIYKWLIEHPVHPTADDIYAALLPQMVRLSRATVYNVMHSFADHGLVTKILTDEGELRFDANVIPHAHFKCTECGTIFDLRGLPRASSILSVPDGFVVQGSAVTHWGLCPMCAAQHPKMRRQRCRKENAKVAMKA